MIQRIQSVWLLLAAMLNSGVFFFDLYYAHIMTAGQDTISHLKVNDHYPSLLLVLVIIAIPLICIFLFKDRKKQIRMSAFALVANAGFISMMLMRVNQYNQTLPTPTQGSYGIGAVLPFVAVILVGLAIGCIRKDEKLVKLLDRLR